jgi:hypothetical protein
MDEGKKWLSMRRRYNVNRVTIKRFLTTGLNVWAKNLRMFQATALRLRRYDDMGKVVGMKTHPIEDFRALLNQVSFVKRRCDGGSIMSLGTTALGHLL